MAITTAGIALVLLAYVVVSDGRDDKTPLKERFSSGKEILTALIGILGTIIGFYFGSSQQSAPQVGSAQQSARQAPRAVTVAEISIQPEKPKRGDEITLATTISGGRTPYSYVILFTPNAIPPIVGQTQNGPITEKFKVPADYDIAKPLTIEALAKDATDVIVLRRLKVDVAQQ